MRRASTADAMDKTEQEEAEEKEKEELAKFEKLLKRFHMHEPPSGGEAPTPMDSNIITTGYGVLKFKAVNTQVCRSGARNAETKGVEGVVAKLILPLVEPSLLDSSSMLVHAFSWAKDGIGTSTALVADQGTARDLSGNKSRTSRAFLFLFFSPKVTILLLLHATALAA